LASYSEYTSLHKVLLGSIEDYRPSCWAWKDEPGVTAENFAKAMELCNDAIPRQILSEVSEDLEDFGRALNKLGVEVIRPPRFVSEPVYETEFFYSYGRDLYNMRDLHIVLGNKIFSSAPSQPNRVLEIIELKDFLSVVSKGSGLEYLTCPLPQLKTNPVYGNLRNALGDLVSAEEIIAPTLGSITQEIWHRLTEEEILFDAANVVRYEGRALYLISSTGNQKAFDWLNSRNSGFDFHKTDVYRSSHIDSTILPLDPETFLVNSVRVNPGNLPDSIKGKRILYFDDVARIPQFELSFHQDFRAKAAEQIAKVGFQTNLQDMSSPWAGMNVLSVNESTVLVESNQVQLIRFLELNGFSVIPIRMRHAYTMLGGLHCTTLDLERA
jgi:glycine amidinotransferase